MAHDQLFADAVHHVIKGEAAVLRRHFRVKHHLKQHVAELLAEPRIVAVVDRFDRLVRFLDQARADGFVRLLPIPGATLRRAKRLHNFKKVFGAVARLLFKLDSHRFRLIAFPEIRGGYMRRNLVYLIFGRIASSFPYFL